MVRCATARFFRGALRSRATRRELDSPEHDSRTRAKDRPWKGPPEGKVAVHNSAMQFVKAQQGDNDVLVFCEGRSRSCRTALEQGTKGLRHMTGRLQTVWDVGKDGLLVERQLCSPGEFRCRAGLCVSAGPNVQHVQQHSGSAAGPVVTAQDKKRIMGRDAVQVPKPQVFGAEVGMPWFWAERKSVDFWKALFTDLGAPQVVDVSPGTGMAARAALELGLHYFGVARNSHHTWWLNIVVDQLALTTILKKHTVMYNEQLADGVHEHFKEWLDGTTACAPGLESQNGGEHGRAWHRKPTGSHSA